MTRLLKITTWILMALAVAFFWIGLRSTTDNMEYTLYAFAAILLAWGSNYWLKKREIEEKDE